MERHSAQKVFIAGSPTPDRMDSLSRRSVLRRGLAVGVTSLAGCMTGFGNESTCTEGRTLHEEDATLDRTASWPMFRYDAANTGHNPDATGPKRDAEIAWRYSACTEADAGVVVHGGRTYAGGLLVDGESGERIGGDWHGHMNTSAVADETLYVSTFDLEARDAATGEHLWTFQTDGDMTAPAAPTVADDTVYVPGSIDDPTVYAVDAVNGDENWRFEADDEVDSTPAVVDGVVYVVDETNTVYALDGATGRERWRRSVETSVWRSAPAVADGAIHLGSADGEVLSLDTEDGSERWRRRVGFDVRGPVAVADGTVFATGDGGSLAALDAASGEEVWRVTDRGLGLGAPAVADGVVYVAAAQQTNSGTVFAFGAADGEELWQLETRDVFFGDYTRVGINGGPVVVDNLVYVATAPGDLYAVTGPE